MSVEEVQDSGVKEGKGVGETTTYRTAVRLFTFVVFPWGAAGKVTTFLGVASRVTPNQHIIFHRFFLQFYRRFAYLVCKRWVESGGGGRAFNFVLRGSVS